MVSGVVPLSRPPHSINYLILNGRLNKRYSTSLKLYTVSNCSRRERGDKREEDQYPTTTYPYNNCFLLCQHLPNQYNTHSLTSNPPSLCYICPPPLSPTAMPPLPPHPLTKIHPTTICPPQFCTHYLTAPANLSQIPTTHQEMSHILLYSAVAQYTPLITNHSTSLLNLQLISTCPQPEQ